MESGFKDERTMESVYTDERTMESVYKDERTMESGYKDERAMESGYESRNKECSSKEFSEDVKNMKNNKIDAYRITQMVECSAVCELSYEILVDSVHTIHTTCMMHTKITIVS